MAFRKFGVALAIMIASSPMGVVAQEMTAAEILALLQAQRENLAAEGDLGVSRTLEFVTESTPESADSGIALGTTVPGEAVAASTEGAAIPEDLVIDLTIFFEFDSALLKPDSKSQVDALCSAIDANEAALAASAEGPAAPTEHGIYRIIGHTDAAGSVQYNLTLSQARADEVVRYMVRECGIDGSLLQAIGMGESRLKDPANPRADSNRRVEIQVVL